MAQAEGLRRLDTGTDSRGWEAVGRLELGKAGFCTAALVAPDLVLTAAHCLWERDGSGRVPIAVMEFRAGLRNGRAAALRKIRRVAHHPDYIWSDDEDASRVRHDLALLELEAPIRLQTLAPYAQGPSPEPGTEVAVVSYARDRAEAASLQNSCHVLNRQAGMLVLSCEVDFGSSGAPVFVSRGGRAELVSVIAAKAEAGGQRVALGAELGDILSRLRAALSNEQFFARPPGYLPQTTDEPPATSGAKFLRPPAP